MILNIDRSWTRLVALRARLLRRPRSPPTGPRSRSAPGAARVRDHHDRGRPSRRRSGPRLPAHAIVTATAAVGVRVRRRRIGAVAASGLVPTVLVLGFGHRGTHAARSLLFPGAGLVEQHPVLAAGSALAGAAATVAWLRWGLDWLVALVVVAVATASALLTPPAHPVLASLGPPAVRAASHEFPLVLLVMSAMAWLRAASWRLPGARRLAEHRAARRSGAGLDDVDRLAPTDRSRCAALLLLAGAHPASDPVAARVVAAGTGPAVQRRARRVGWWARGRRGPDPFAVDHAYARSALALATVAAPDPAPAGGPALTGPSDDHPRPPAVDPVVALARDAGRSALGVPASEPGWVRPLDATLAALALARAGHPEAGERWQVLLAGAFGLRRGHRAAWLWTPLAVPAGRAPDWEQAAATGLARAAGWVGTADWAALRPRVLGAAARGTARPHDERLIAAARIWLAQIDDPEAARIVGRPTVHRDPLAVALDRLAASLAAGHPLVPTAAAPARLPPGRGH